MGHLSLNGWSIYGLLQSRYQIKAQSSEDTNLTVKSLFKQHKQVILDTTLQLSICFLFGLSLNVQSSAIKGRWYLLHGGTSGLIRISRKVEVLYFDRKKLYFSSCSVWEKFVYNYGYPPPVEPNTNYNFFARNGGVACTPGIRVKCSSIFWHVQFSVLFHSFIGRPWIGKCTSYVPESGEFNMKWYRGSYEGLWYPERRYHPTKLHFSSVISWGVELTANKTLKRTL